MSREAERRAGVGEFYPNDPVEARYHRDVQFHRLVQMLESFLRSYEHIAEPRDDHHRVRTQSIR